MQAGREGQRGCPVRFSASLVSSSSIIAALGSALLAGGALLGCGALVDSSESERSTALAQRVPERPQRTREGRAGPLRRLAGEAGTMKRKPGRHAHDDAGVPATEPPPADAGAPEPPGMSPVSDAGVAGGGDAAAPPSPLPPEPLPRDVVAQSALPIYGLEAGVVLGEVELWDRLAASPAICFGEYHDVPAHHYAETRALDELAARAVAAGNTLAVGFEMIQRPYQTALSAFVAAELGEDAFLAQTEYATRWGYDFALYRPLFEGARAQHLPALALNMRAEITRKIGRTGLESLDPAELAELPELVLDDEEHRAFIFGLFGVLPEHAAEFGLENVYVAQTVWDETMADTSARWLIETGASARLLDFAGGAHCHRSAIPRRITRRTPSQPSLSVHAVFESELADGSFTPEGYDVLVVLDD
jgi:uncharacterized iron-regulated protein